MEATVSESRDTFNKLVAVVADIDKVVDEDAKALDVAILCKKAELAVEALKMAVRPTANAAFEAAVKASPDIKQWPVNELGFVSRYTPSGSWTYPADVIAADTKLKNDREAAKKAGTAKKTLPLVDAKKDTLFVVRAN